MAANAQYSHVHFGRLESCRIVGMLGQWPVARLARDMRVHAFALHLEDFGVAALASPMTGKHDRLCGNFGQGGTPVVPVLAESLGHEDASHHQEQNDTSSKDRCHSPEMPGIL